MASCKNAVRIAIREQWTPFNAARWGGKRGLAHTNRLVCPVHPSCKRDCKTNSLQIIISFANISEWDLNQLQQACCQYWADLSVSKRLNIGSLVKQPPWLTVWQPWTAATDCVSCLAFEGRQACCVCLACHCTLACINIQASKEQYNLMPPW